MKLRMLSPRSCIPPHGVSHPEKVYELANKFILYGWGENQLPLIGYPLKGKIQLLSGTHRWNAAKLAKLELIPVLIRKRKQVENAVGDLDKWKVIMDAEV
jgi:hypothetical protein